jgi:phosphomannomutase
LAGIFKAYDIRGVVPDELDAAAAHRIGRATARFVGSVVVAVGRDARSSSPQLFDALVRGLDDEGCEIVDLGLVCTPMLYHAVEELGAGAGVMITASHNPGRYNGFKLCREHAIPIGEASGLREIEAVALQGRRPRRVRCDCAVGVEYWAHQRPRPFHRRTHDSNAGASHAARCNHRRCRRELIP